MTTVRPVALKFPSTAGVSVAEGWLVLLGVRKGGRGSPGARLRGGALTLVLMGTRMLC